MKLVIGLGNPGKEYELTRHNIGFMIIDKYLGDVKYKEKFNGLFYEVNKDDKVIFIKPLTYMNNSGECVNKFAKYYGIENKDILVIQDELDMEIGTYKFKINSTSGGHNGIKSIIRHLGKNDFFRLKIGIKTIKKHDTIDFVLGRFSKEEINKIDFDTMINSIDDFIKYDNNYVMNKYNGK